MDCFVLKFISKLFCTNITLFKNFPDLNINVLMGMYEYVVMDIFVKFLEFFTI